VIRNADAQCSQYKLDDGAMSRSRDKRCRGPTKRYLREELSCDVKPNAIYKSEMSELEYYYLRNPVQWGLFSVGEVVFHSLLCVPCHRD
jgi:hypothetical protein